MPDFFISDRDLKNTWLTEVKFRKQWNDEVHKELGKQLKEQVKEWSPLYLILFLGTSAKKKGKLISSWIAVAELTIRNDKLVVASEHFETPKCWDDISWKDFSRIQKIFPLLDDKKKWKENVLKMTKNLLGELLNLDLLEK